MVPAQKGDKTYICVTDLEMMSLLFNMLFKYIISFILILASTLMIDSTQENNKRGISCFISPLIFNDRSFHIGVNTCRDILKEDEYNFIEFYEKKLGVKTSNVEFNNRKTIIHDETRRRRSERETDIKFFRCIGLIKSLEKFIKYSNCVKEIINIYAITIEEDINSKTTGPQEIDTNYLIEEDINQVINISTTETSEHILSPEQSSCSISSKESAHQDYELDQLKKQNNDNEVDFWEDDKYFKDEWISPIIRNQSHLLSIETVLRDDVKKWFEYLYNPTNPKLSRFRCRVCHNVGNLNELPQYVPEIAKADGDLKTRKDMNGR
jgi:hypothetical protein